MDWNDLRIFLAVARAGQLSAAASLLDVDPTTVSRRLRRLEATLQQRLFEQTREGQVIGATETSFAARYGFSGEGQTWMRTERFSLVKAELHRTTDAEPGHEPPVNLTYARCPG